MSSRARSPGTTSAPDPSQTVAALAGPRHRGSVLGHLTTFDEFSARDWATFQRDSFQLEAFRTLDFPTAMEGELRKVISKPSNLHLRHLALVAHFCEQKSKQYKRRPTRHFHAGSPEREAKLSTLYRRSKLDQALAEAQHKSWAQSAVVMVPELGTRREGAERYVDPSRINLHSFVGGEVWVEGDPMLTDLRNADRLTVRWPLRNHLTDGDQIVWFGRRVYTPTEAYVEAPGGSRTGIFNERMTNPLGYVPALGVRHTSPPRGWWWPSLPYDLLTVQIGLIIGMADIENIVRLKTAPREALIGGNAAGAAKNVDGGPETLAVFPGGPDMRYEVHNLDPRIDRYTAVLELMIKLLGSYRSVNPEGLWASTGITGAAKEVERLPEVEAVETQEVLWGDLEQDLVEVVADLATTGPSALPLTSPKVEVEYHYPQAVQNDLQRAQSLALMAALGLEDLVQLRALQDGTSKDRAREAVAESLEQWKRVVESWKDASGTVQAPPGMESLAQQILRPV